jgi:hypothetical protein
VKLRVAAVLVSSALAGLAVACAPAASPDAPPIAAVYTRQCGKCHSPPEPKSHTRPQLEDAFARHKNRAHLTQDEWAQMVDYLAAPATTN